MAKQYILTVLAANRTGILAALANAMDELRGNTLDVSQAVIRRYFTMIMAAEFPEDRTPDVIVDHIRAVCRPYGAEVILKDPDTEMAFHSFDETLDEPNDCERYVLTVAGRDRPGILRLVAHRLTQEGIDLVDLQGMRREADQSFMTSMELSVPKGIDALRLRQELDNEFSSDDITVTLQHRRVVAALAHPEPPGFNVAVK